jgi:hypothetical protein
MNGDLERMCEKTAIAYEKLLPQYFQQELRTTT